MTDLDGSAPAPPVDDSVGPLHSLQMLFDEHQRAFLPVRLSYPAADGVVLRHDDRHADVAVETGEVRSIYVGNTARLITDPVRELELMRHAAGLLSRRAVEAEQERQDESDRHRQEMRDIRAYAVDKCRVGDICQDGLNAFLQRFDMAPDHTRVRFTITGSYQVAGGDTARARSDGAGYLDVDLSDVDCVVDDSLSFNVSIDDVRPVDADD
jgi:hypothetical protein